MSGAVGHVVVVGMLAGGGLRDTEKWGDGDKASRRKAGGATEIVERGGGGEREG